MPHFHFAILVGFVCCSSFPSLSPCKFICSFFPGCINHPPLSAQFILLSLSAQVIQEWCCSRRPPPPLASTPKQIQKQTFLQIPLPTHFLPPQLQASEVAVVGKWSGCHVRCFPPKGVTYTLGFGRQSMVFGKSWLLGYVAQCGDLATIVCSTGDL